MKKAVLLCSALALLALPRVASAATYVVPGADPSATYTVCNHSAQYVVNDRAGLVSAGHRTYTDLGDQFTIGYAPGVYMQTKRLKSYSYRSLSADGSCYNP